MCFDAGIKGLCFSPQCTRASRDELVENMKRTLIKRFPWTLINMIKEKQKISGYRFVGNGLDISKQ